MPARAITTKSPVRVLPGLTPAHLDALKAAKLGTVGAVAARLRAAGCARIGAVRVPAMAAAYALHRPKTRHTRAAAAAIAARLCAAIVARFPRALCCPVGSLRRRAAHVGDIDLLTSAALGKMPMEAIVEELGGRVLSVFARGRAKRSMIVQLAASPGGRPVRFPLDIFHSRRADWGSALAHFTGNKVFNIRLRAAAKKRGFSLSQHGAKRLSDGKVFRFNDERALFDFFGFRWHEPSERTKK